MKSSAILLGDLGDIFSLDRNSVAQCGEHFLSQLTRARHRGAFELAAAGFRNLCIQTRKSEPNRDFMNIWLEDALSFFKVKIIAYYFPY